MVVDPSCGALEEGLFIRSALAAGGLDERDLELYLEAIQSVSPTTATDIMRAKDLHIINERSATGLPLPPHLSAILLEFKNIKSLKTLPLSNSDRIVVTLYFDLIDIRRRYHIALQDKLDLIKVGSFPLPEEVKERLILSNEMPELAHHYTKTALDHLVEAISSTLSKVPGSTTSSGVIVWSGVLMRDELEALDWVSKLGVEFFVTGAIVAVGETYEP